MRTWVYNRVKAILTSMDVYSSGNANDPVTRPFAIVSMDVEQPWLGMPASARVQEIPFAVWVHDKPGSMLAIDSAAVALKDSLPTVDGAVVGGMSLYELRWDSTGSDAYDDHYATNTRPVRFVMTTRR